MADGFKAEIVIGAKDLTGGALKGIGASLRGITGDLKGISGNSGMARLGEAVKGVGRGMWNVASASARVLANLTGIGAIGIAGVFVGLTAALKGSAAQLEEMSKTARQLRMPLQTMREFAYVASQQGVSWETATGGLKKAGKAYFDLRNDIGGARKTLAEINPALMRQIAGAKDSKAAFDIMIEAVHRARSAGEAAKLSELFFGTDEFTKIAELSGKEFADAMAKARSLLGTITDEQGRAIESTNDALEDFRDSIRGLRDQLAVDLWPAMKPVVEGMSKWVSENREWIRTSISGGLKTVIDYLKSIDWGQVGTDIKALFSGLRDAISSMSELVEAIGGWKPVLAGMAALALAGPIKEIIGLAGALVQLTAAISGLSVVGVPAWLLAFMAGGSAVAVNKLSSDVQAENLKPGYKDYSGGFTPEENAARDYKQWHGVPFEGGMHRAGRGAGPMPGRARGGAVAAGRWTMVGEEGPELLRIGSGGHVFPAGQTRAMLGGDEAATRALARALLDPARIIAEPLKPLGGALKDLKDAVKDLSGGAPGSGGFRSGNDGTSGYVAGAGGFRARGQGPGRGVRGTGSAGISGGTGNAFLDLIGRAEGTDKGRGYNETLAYGAFTGGNRDLTSMTLDEIDAMQGEMLAHPRNSFNSSAAGRYQIVRKTLRSLRRKLGLTGKELYDKGMQDQLALELASGRGADVAGLRNEWEGLRRVSPSEILSAYRAKDEPRRAPEIAEDRAERFRPALRSDHRQQVDIGRGELRVTIDRDGRVTSVKPSFEGNLSVNAGFDRTGGRTFRPGIQGRN